MPKYFTVVYEVHDEEKFMAVAQRATAEMMSSPTQIQIAGYDITGCGWGDSMTRADAHAALSDYSDEEAIQHLLGEEDEDLSEEGMRRRIREILG